MNEETQVVKIGKGTVPRRAAGAIASMTREGLSLQIHTIGAASANQAIKSVAIANDYLEKEGIKLLIDPEFSKVTIDGEEKTSIVMNIEKKVESKPSK